MAEFSRLIITEKGQQLISKIFSGTTGVKLTKISTSSKVYGETELSKLEALEETRQTNPVAEIEITKSAAVKVVTVFNNVELTEGYYLRTVGLFAEDPDEGEILYGVTAELSGNCYMPPYNGVTQSALDVEMVTAVGNAENLSLEVDPAAAVTVGQFNKHTTNESIHTTEEWKKNVEQSVGAQTAHVSDTDVHATAEKQELWNGACEDSNRALSMAGINSGNISTLQGQMKLIMEALYSDITQNPWSMNFNNLEGITVIHGVYNATMQRIKC